MLDEFVKVTLMVFYLQGVVASMPETISCSNADDCSKSTTTGKQFCCGTCEQGFCCGNETLVIDSTECKANAPDDGGINSSAKMLGVIIGGMVISFTGAMVVHGLIRKLLRRRRKRRNRDGENGVPISEPATSNTQVGIELELPSYDQIHLYKTVGHSNYIAIEPVDMSSHKSAKTENGNHVVTDEDLESSSSSPPPPYSISSRVASTEHNTTQQSEGNASVSEEVETAKRTPPSREVQVDESPSTSSHTRNSAADTSTQQTSETIIVRLMNLLQTLESGDNTEHTHNAIQSARKYLNEVVDKGRPKEK